MICFHWSLGHFVTFYRIFSIFRHDKEAKYDYFLRKFEYSKALNAALMPFVANKHPERTVAVLRELQKRKALSKALKERDSKVLKQLTRFLVRCVPTNII